METPGGMVKATVMQRGKIVRVEMGAGEFLERRNPRGRPAARSHQRADSSARRAI